MSNRLVLAMASAKSKIGLRKSRVEYTVEYTIDTLADYSIHE